MNMFFFCSGDAELELELEHPVEIDGNDFCSESAIVVLNNKVEEEGYAEAGATEIIISMEKDSYFLLEEIGGLPGLDE